ncbi:MAG: hypothetical protein R3343_01125 [Nitriliruptorales bacterium]|nr:hypothetical protein [Nitriliruptorales bacterium]
MKRITTLILAAAALTAFAAPALANQGISDGAALYADGEQFRTKDATDLPPPSGNNAHSFDDIYVIQGGHADQLPVAEAAPGERDFNGGRWAVQVLEWNGSGDAPLLTDDEAVDAALASGDLTVVHTNARYFLCPVAPLN